MMQYWPVFVWSFGLFISSIAMSFGCAMWIAGKLAEQDAKRIELKEAILKEVRDSRHSLYDRIEQQYTGVDDKMDDMMKEVGMELRDLGTRVTKLESVVKSRP